MKKALLAALLELETDHQFLANLFGGVRAAVLPCGTKDADEGGCDATHCPHGAACARLMREQFHRSMYAIVGHFGREDRIIRDVLPPADFQAHTEQHADLSAQVQTAIIHFSESRDVKTARRALLAVAGAIDLHHSRQDKEFLQLLPGYANPSPAAAGPIRVSSVTPLPLTGNAVIDAEHQQLHAIVYRSQTLCQSGQPHCGDCPAATRQTCSEEAIDLITDALKCMVEHFRREDTMLRELAQKQQAQHDQTNNCQTNSDLTTAHLDSHAELSQRLSQLVGDYEDNNTALCLSRLGDILQDWLHDHITRHDQPCFGHVTEAVAAARSGEVSRPPAPPAAEPALALAYA